MIVLIVIIATATSGGGGKSPVSSSTLQPAAAANGAASSPARSAAPSAAPSSAAPATTTAPAPSRTTAAPQYTVSQQQAIDAAESYLSEDTGWSQAGLIAQLSSSYGNGFSVSDATVAVDSLTSVNWNQQAVLAAQGYMTSEPGWSACGLVQQLDSPYGSQFTQAQAEYAVQTVGLGSC